MEVTIKSMGADSQADEISSSEEFEAIFQQHWNRVLGLLSRLVADQQEAEDLALETFWRLYQNPPRDKSNLSGWLYRVASNLGFNALRSRQRRQSYEREAGKAELLLHSSQTPAQEVERKLERQQVRAVLAAMNPKQARILLLRHSGLSYAEIASAIKVSSGSVGTLLSRAETEFERLYHNHTSSREGE